MISNLLTSTGGRTLTVFLSKVLTSSWSSNSVLSNLYSCFSFAFANLIRSSRVLVGSGDVSVRARGSVPHSVDASDALHPESQVSRRREHSPEIAPAVMLSRDLSASAFDSTIPPLYCSHATMNASNMLGRLRRHICHVSARGNR